MGEVLAGRQILYKDVLDDPGEVGAAIKRLRRTAFEVLTNTGDTKRAPFVPEVAEGGMTGI